MKKYFYLLLMLPVLTFGQVKKQNYDYFVQFNTQRFAQKVNIDSLLNHKAVKMITGEEAKTKLSEFASFIDKSKAVTLHGNFTDTIPYYQINMPLLDVKGLNGFIQKKVDESNEAKNDSIPATIKIYPKYRVYSPKNADYTMAWNDNNLVVYKLLEPNYNSFREISFDSAAVAVDTAMVVVDTAAYEVVEELKEKQIGDPEEFDVAPPAVVEDDAVVDTVVADSIYNEEYYKKLDEEYEREKQLKRIEDQVKQEAQLATMFENGFVAPTSDKVKTDSDISIWFNFQSVFDKINSFKYMLHSMPTVPIYKSVYTIEGMYADFYFEDQKARIEYSAEYSEPMAKIARKIINRKPNKDIFKFFPKEEPLAYMSYHFDTGEMLKNYPLLMEQSFSQLPLDSQDVEIINDFFTTVIDEKETAKLLDGDISMFLHNIKTYDETITTTSYNEEYEEVEEEKVVKKTKPVFSFVITSTHPTMADKLLKLGLRKNLLQKENEYYFVKKSAEFGGLFIRKEGDAIIFTNGLDYLKDNGKSDFSKKVKKQLSKNYMYGNFDMRNFIKSYFLNQDLGTDTAKYIQLSNRFKNIEFKASNKLENNKTKMLLELNSNLSDKNIILQTLDLFTLLK
ncbi:hypothetical protein NAT51_00775 [Flavobacterium amniphilum]|uniref:hypothetical protein n=1 Tax=Flavobacterium amniphilum TaxID=1834035 RepID=UPI002029BDE6|nr:hypothetical protein [Flavobacterium amniphilum]MCL9804037.1 hypothetical protein [Flavobacterium amniphilum]